MEYPALQGVWFSLEDSMQVCFHKVKNRNKFPRRPCAYTEFGPVTKHFVQRTSMGQMSRHQKALLRAF